MTVCALKNALALDCRPASCLIDQPDRLGPCPRMSLGYADRLSFREDLGGQLGAPELQDSPEEVEAKVARLAELVRR